MQTTSLADVRTQLNGYVEDVVSTHERVTITTTRSSKPRWRAVTAHSEATTASCTGSATA